MACKPFRLCSSSCKGPRILQGQEPEGEDELRGLGMNTLCEKLLAPPCKATEPAVALKIRGPSSDTVSRTVPIGHIARATGDLPRC